MEKKKCLDCEIEKLINEFTINRRNKDGHGPLCKSCERIRRHGDLKQLAITKIEKAKSRWVDLPGEIWKRVIEFPNYEVSNKGRVRNPKIWKLMTGVQEKTGYVSIAFSKDKHQTKRRLGRVVAETFIRSPKAEEQVNHKDANKANNCADNLEWVTGDENMLHARPRCKRGSEHPMSKLIESDVRYIKDELAKGTSKFVLAEKFSVTERTIRNVRSNRHWQHVK